MPFTRAFKLTSGYTAPLFFGLLACELPLMLVRIYLPQLLLALGGGSSLTGLALASGIDCLQAAIIGAFISLSYRFFTTQVAKPDWAPA